MTDVRVLLVTAPDAQTAESIVGTLVAESLIACGTIALPATSIYRWQGETERTSEVLIMIKTTDSAVAAVTSRITELHPYEVPEVLSLPVLGGYEPYLSWVRESVAT